MYYNDTAGFYWYHPKYPDRLQKEEVAEMSMKTKISKLNTAVKRKDMADVEVLLASGIDANKKGQDGRTCIMSASFKTRPEFLPFFLALEGVDLNVQDKLGHTALSLATSSNNISGAKMLIDCYHDIDVNLPDRKGITPLHNAISKCELEMIQMLLQSGADPNQKDKDGVSPLLLACRTNSCAVLTALIEANGDINSADKRGRTPAIWCCRQGASAKLELLLRHDVDLTKIDKIDQMSAFRQAIWKDQTECAIMIMESPLCPNLLRSREPEMITGIVRTYWEVARSRKNVELQNSIYEHMQKQILACLLKNNQKMKLSIDLLELISSFSA